MAYSISNFPSKVTSGQRFWAALSGYMKAHSMNTAASPTVAFFNISAPMLAILAAKWRGQKVVIRLCGTYHEKVTPAAIAALDFGALRLLMRIVYRLTGSTAAGGMLMNFLSHNYKLVIKVWFADFIIYQSQFSRSLWQAYYPHKPSTVIHNGVEFRGRPELPPVGERIQLMTTYDPWRCSKRMHDLVQFIIWHNQNHPLLLDLFILGYDTNSRPANLTAEDVNWIEQNAKWMPRFTEYTAEIVEIIKKQDMFITLSYRDHCPNAMIEAMSHGLPVVALDSGGIPEVIGEAGEVVPVKDHEGYFSSFDHSFDYAEFNLEDLSRAIKKIYDNRLEYGARVQRRFEDALDLKVVARKYQQAANALEAETTSRLS